MQLQRRAIIAQDAGGNPNHSKENGEFTSGSGGSKSSSPSMSDVFSGKTKYNEKTDTHSDVSKSAEEKFMQPKTKSGAENSPLAALRKHVTGAVESGKSEAITEQPAEQKYKTSLATEQGRKNHRSIAAAFNSGQSKKIGNYSTDGKAIYLHGNKIVEKGPNGEINFTLAGWPTATTRASLRDFGIRVGQSKGKQMYSHSGGEEEIDSNKMYRAKDEQPDMALDPNSAAVNSPTPWKGRNLDNDPVGDRSASPDLASAGGGDCNVYTGRDLG